jgi:hypothetical protein
MANITDPARELGDISAKLGAPSPQAGFHVLAATFGHEPDSAAFARIVCCILERAELVAQIIDASSMDDDHKLAATQDIANFKRAFSPGDLTAEWNSANRGAARLRESVKAFQYLSPIVRSHTNYPKLSKEEIDEFIQLIDVYVEEMRKNDDLDEFVRKAIQDGLAAFRFQLENMEWLGAGYTLAAFRQVVMTYEIINMDIQGQHNPDAEAALRGVFSVIAAFKKKIDEAKSYTDAAKFAMTTYNVGTSTIAGLYLTGTLPLLPHLGG